MSIEPNEDRLGELLLRWDELRRQGRDLTAGELCTDCPELLQELARRIQAVREMDSVLASEETQRRSTSLDGVSNGATPNRGLPAALHASAVYRPRRHHAAGGLGEVLTAHQDELDRLVALKRIRPDKLHDAARRRFLREAAITARLQHPGIVPIYGLGQDDDGPFYTMPLIQGRTLQEAIEGFHGAESLQRDPSQRSLKSRGLLQQFITVCNTVSYAHDQGIVHRDLKPSNIMLGPYGETLVMDWGLAKWFRADDPAAEAGEDAPSPSPSPEDLTAIGAVLGTPRYMSPEQARGQPVGPPSDIFSLGLLLYAILTGKLAFDEVSLQGPDPLKAVRDAAVVPPRHRDPRLPRALEAICLKALSARPEDRYASARALADDIEHWLADEPVTAWREPWLVRARRWAKRHRTAVAATAAGCAAALLLGGTWLYSYQRQVSQETTAVEAALVRAEQVQGEARAAWSERLDATAWVRAEDLATAAGALDSRRLSAGLRRRVRVLSEVVKAEAARARADAALLSDLAAARAARLADGYDAPAGYRRTFERYGIRLDAEGPSASADALRDRPRRVVLKVASYLDDWAMLLRRQGKPSELADRITALAHTLDPNPWRDALRDAMAPGNTAERRQAVLRMAAAPDLSEQPSQTITLLAAALQWLGESEKEIGLLQAARFQYPEDPWVHQALGVALITARPPRREDALRAFTAEATLRPEAGHTLAVTLRDTGRTAEAISVLEDVVRRQANVGYMIQLGEMKAAVGRRAESQELFRRAVALSRTELAAAPDDFGANHNLATALTHLGDHAGAIAAYRKAVRANPGSSAAHTNLGLALRRAGDLRGAVAEDKEAVRLAPLTALPHNNLGVHLSASGDNRGAVRAFREAIRLRPDYPEAHSNLGTELRRQGDLAGAVVEHQEAVRLKPDSAIAHLNLGAALGDSGNLPGAVLEFREATRLAPEDPDAHCNLGHALRDLGQFPQALDAMERGHALGARQPRWSSPSGDWVKQCRRLVEFEGKLPKIFSGQDRPTDATERADLALVAHAKGLDAAAARLFIEAFAERPALADDLASGRRYNAACDAALAGCGKGQDEPPPGPADRARLRTQAMDWLQADRAAWARRLDVSPTAARAEVVQNLRHWRIDVHLAGVRNPAEIAKLPDAERHEWQAFWAAVDLLLQRAEK